MDAQIALLHLRQGLARRTQAAHDAGEQGDQQDAGEREPERLLEEQAPAPIAQRRAQRRGQPEPREIERQRLPRLGGPEIPGRLERGDEIDRVQHVPRGAERIQHGGDQARADGDVDVGVPRPERGVAGDAIHRAVAHGEHRGAADDQPPRDGGETRQARRREEGHAHTQQRPARPRARQHVLPLCGAALLRQLCGECGRRGHGDKMSGAHAAG